MGLKDVRILFSSKHKDKSKILKLHKICISQAALFLFWEQPSNAFSFFWWYFKEVWSGVVILQKKVVIFGLILALESLYLSHLFSLNIIWSKHCSHDCCQIHSYFWFICSVVNILTLLPSFVFPKEFYFIYLPMK